MELLEKISEFADAHDMFPPGGLILAAVSGGADSVCLLAALLELSGKKAFSIAAVHFNHKLRGSASDDDAIFVEKLCAKSGIRLFTSSGDVRRFAEVHKLGIEDAARRMRYDFFYETAHKTGAGRIATAHTADDNAETVLLNLTRGAGLKGLCGIPPKRGFIIRPMLTATRLEVLQFLKSRALTFVEDSTNSLDIYRRNILRHRVVPILTQLNPRFAESVALSSSLLREDEEYLSGLAWDFIAGQNADGPLSSQSLDVRALLALPRPVSSRVIRLTAGVNLTARHVSNVLTLCASDIPSGKLSLPGITIRRAYERLIFGDIETVATFTPVTLPVDGIAVIPELGLNITCKRTKCAKKIHNSFNTYLFKYDNLCGNIVIRPRESGDKIALFGGSGTKSLKKLFIEKRIPKHERALIPVIADEAGVLAVHGVASGARAIVDERSLCRPGDNIIKIDFKEMPHEK